MYFDTLKISTIEQTASQSSAKGGIGNPNLITWDYGKEISVKLEDALFTPASQSLMWGGKFGLDKTVIKGFWNPYQYKKDEKGRTIYFAYNDVTGTNPSVSENQTIIEYICPCTGEKKKGLITALTGTYKYTDDFLGYGKKELKENVKYLYKEKSTDNTYQYNCELFSKGQPAEKAVLIMNNFSTFNFSEKEKSAESDTDSSDKLERFLLKTIDTQNCESWLSPNSFINSKDTFFDYDWIDCDVQMISLQGEQEIYYQEHSDIRIRVNSEGINKKILIKEHSKNCYNSSLDFYKEVSYMIGGEAVFTKQFKIGTFYINDTFNANGISTQEFIHPIEDGIENVPYLDTMEKHIANKTFCINTDANTKMSFLKDLPEYQQSSLTVFIDPKTERPYEPNSNEFHSQTGAIINGNLRIIKQNEIYHKWQRSIAPQYTTLGHQIIVDANHFPGTYRLIGTTYSRSRKDGKDSKFQFEIPLCKMSAETNLMFQADGEPTTFTMNMSVMRRDDGVMMKLTQYDYKNDCCSGSTSIIPHSANYDDDDCMRCGEPEISVILGERNYKIVLPEKNNYYCCPVDVLEPFNNSEAYLMLPKDNESVNKMIKDLGLEVSDDNVITITNKEAKEKYRNILLIATQEEGAAAILVNGEVYWTSDVNVNTDGNITFLTKNDKDVDSLTFTVSI